MYMEVHIYLFTSMLYILRNFGVIHTLESLDIPLYKTHFLYGGSCRTLSLFKN